MNLLLNIVVLLNKVPILSNADTGADTWGPETPALSKYNVNPFFMLKWSENQLWAHLEKNLKVKPPWEKILYPCLVLLSCHMNTQRKLGILRQMEEM